VIAGFKIGPANTVSTPRALEAKKNKDRPGPGGGNVRVNSIQSRKNVPV
jgi:hypothetical protein